MSFRLLEEVVESDQDKYDSYAIYAFSTYWDDYGSQEILSKDWLGPIEDSIYNDTDDVIIASVYDRHKHNKVIYIDDKQKTIIIKETMNNLVQSVRRLDYESRHFIGEAINMFKLNFDNFNIEIYPITKKAFYLLATVDNISIERHFTAAEIKGVKGTYKLASMIAKLS